LVLLYCIIGISFAATASPFWLWAIVWATAGIGAEIPIVVMSIARSWIRIDLEVRFVLIAVAGILAMPIFQHTETAISVVIISGAAIAVGVATAWVGEKLLKSFSRFQLFLTLVATSWLGLGLGWLVHWVFQQVSRG
jgi:hypothetical protein